MSVHLELAFEEEVCEVLGSHGWLYADKTADHYDRKLALYPPDLTAWLEGVAEGPLGDLQAEKRQ
jgi:type I restriction enzyme, R subunit